MSERRCILKRSLLYFERTFPATYPFRVKVT